MEGQSALRLDLMIGARSIAAYLGVAERVVYYMAERYKATGEGVPVVREKGMGIVASRASLRAYLEKRLGVVEEVVPSA